MSWHYSDSWAAGFFDGEGCVSISRRKRTTNWTETYVAVQIAQKDIQPLLELQSRFGGCLTVSKRPCGSFWYLRWHGTQAEKFLTAIAPFSLVKRKEIAIALELRSLIGKPGKRAAHGIESAKLNIYRRFKEECRGVALPA